MHRGPVDCGLRLLQGVPVNYRTPTPLLRARGLGSAKEGVGHWWIQRVTAAALLPLVIWLLVTLALLDGRDYASLLAWVARPVNSVLLIATALALFWHSALGLRVIIEDYTASKGLKFGLIIAVNLSHALFAIVSIFAVLKIALESA